LPDSKTLAACRDRLAKQADLTQYTTTAAVEDLDAVRQALGYSRINLFGVSYGTRVALEYLRRHESNVRAIAVSGVFSPAYRIGVQGPAESQHALQQLFAMCAADTACNGAFQNVAAELDAVLTRLDTSPATATIPLTTASAPLAVTISRTVFARQLFQLLHYREDLMGLPLAIHHTAANDFVPFAALALVREANRDPIADGMALSVTCAQDASFTTPAIAAAARGTFLRADRAQYLNRACAVWPHAPQDKIATTPIRAATPALLISGALDPITPKEYAADVAKTLPNSLHVVVANVAHVPANPCVHGLVAAFMKAGSAKGLDTGCAARFPPLKFVTKIPTEG
jgi:pimeloyl-ACP methyl ester carboxylesterase